MKIESVNVTVFQYPTRRVSDSAGHSHPGGESMAKMAMLTITADMGRRAFRLRLRKSCARSVIISFSQSAGGTGPV